MPSTSINCPRGDPNKMWLLFFVATSGFFTDSYNLFATNVILPSLAYVYWPDEINGNHEITINALTLGGSAVGQLLFGILADVFGRTRLYGIELVIVIVSTVGIAISSSGVGKSMNMYALVCVWRFVMGVGIGGEYPLSAIITAEWAATPARAYLLAWVFLMQPLGQLVAQLVSLFVLSSYKHSNPAFENCPSPGCSDIVDKVWRWVAGVGAIPCVIAILFRWTITDPGLWTVEVGKNDLMAVEDTLAAVGASPEDERRWRENHVDNHSSQDGQRNSAQNPRQPRLTLDQRIELLDKVQDFLDDISVDRDFIGFSENKISVPNTQGITTAHTMRAETINVVRNFFTECQQREISRDETQIKGPTVDQQSVPPHSRRLDFFQEVVQGLHYAWNSFERYRQDLKEYLFTNGNWRYLLGSSLSWFLLDFAFYGLGINSPREIAQLFQSHQADVHLLRDDKAWSDQFRSWVSDPTTLQANPNENGAPDPPPIYLVLRENARQSILGVCIASLVGSIAMVVFINHIPRTGYLAVSFIVLWFWLLLTGIVFHVAHQHPHGHQAIIVLYAICQFFFNFGANTLIFIIPAEIFPTRFRGTFYGVAAASGKVASVIVQSSISSWRFGHSRTYQPDSQALGWILIIFSFIIALGAPAAWAWLPQVQELGEWEPVADESDPARSERQANDIQLTDHHQQQRPGAEMQRLRRYKLFQARENKSLEELAQGFTEASNQKNFDLRPHSDKVIESAKDLKARASGYWMRWH
ncbi:MAG: hypothetical protein M1820_008957 [Bogoriella megaspora]|nr:MAG: hypothetical protein M1820_008957 [Bogoriella megaspora]